MSLLEQIGSKAAVVTGKFFACNLRTKGAQPETVVKTRPPSVWLVLALGSALIVAACSITQTFGPGVAIHSAVLIYPGTRISSADQKELDAILKEFNKSLYKIETYDHGNLVKTRGLLQETLIDKLLFLESKKIPLSGRSQDTLQIGLGCWVACNVSTSKVPSTPMKPPKQELQNSARLVSRVTPIMLKYGISYPSGPSGGEISGSGMAH